MAKKKQNQEDVMKILSEIRPKEKEQTPVPFDELLLKTINVKPRKTRKKWKVQKDVINQLESGKLIMVICPNCGNILTRKTYNKEKSLSGFECKQCDILLMIKQNTKSS